MEGNDFTDKMEKVINKKRESDPLIKEYNKIFKETFPVESFEKMFMLGQISVLAHLRNNTYEYMCKDCKNVIDFIIEKSIKKDEIAKEYLEKLTKL